MQDCRVEEKKTGENLQLNPLHGIHLPPAY